MNDKDNLFYEVCSQDSNPADKSGEKHYKTKSIS